VPQLREWRSYVIVGAFAVAAVFTPPDVISQFMMAIPLCLLYELGILLAAWLVKVPLDPHAPRSDLSAATKD
jgi:sec-independent protein translocase protein TatC